MRQTAQTLVLGALVMALAACAGSTDEPSGSGPTATTAAPTQVPTVPSPAESPSVSVPQDVPEDVVLGPEALGTAEQPRTQDAEVGAWALPEPCGAVVPDAAAMLTVTQGTGEFEEPVGLHQVAVFADADAAVSAAGALTTALTECARIPSGTGTTYVLEDVAVGAQGHGLATDYYGASVGGPLDEALGSYLVTTRRGSAVTVVGTLGGESTVGAARAHAVALAQSAWELLCVYDSAGC
ncbi:MAG TPA: hypothetical protein VGC04_02810 [Cellulomonas sp.]